MRYNHEDAVDRFAVIPAGVYDAVVEKATNDVSKAGNDMIEIYLKVFTPAGVATSVKDYLVSTPGALYKVRHFCDSAGIDFSKNELEAGECVDKNVKVKLKLEKSEEWGDKNSVEDYVKRDKSTAPIKEVPAKDPLIPF